MPISFVEANYHNKARGVHYRIGFHLGKDKQWHSELHTKAENPPSHVAGGWTYRGVVATSFANTLDECLILTGEYLIKYYGFTDEWSTRNG